jgi:hypothetical protein
MPALAMQSGVWAIVHFLYTIFPKMWKAKKIAQKKQRARKRNAMPAKNYRK